MVEKIRPYQQLDSSKQFTGKTLPEAKEVRDIHRDRIRENPLIIAFGIGMETNEELDILYVVFKAYLAREPTQEEKSKLAEEIEGIPVRYKVTGKSVAGQNEGSIYRDSSLRSG